MFRRLGWMAAALAVLTLPLFAQEPTTAADSTANATSSPVVATFKGGVITEAELDAKAHSSLVPLLQQEYEIKRSAISDLVYEHMLEAEAKAEGISADELYRREVTEKVKAPSEDEVNSILSKHRAQLAKDDAQAHQQVVDVLRQRDIRQLESELREKLLADAGLSVKLEPPRVDVPIDADDPAVGPADAPVTLVEFADYQCPFCTRAESTVEKVRATYGDQVRLVVKQLPLPMHPQARPAAEAALCAQQQGGFWKMHKWLFANHDNLSLEAIKKQAPELGLDADKLASCLDSHQEASRIDADLKEASEVGANATPTFFVNGRLVRGAQPFSTVAEIINDELSRKGLPIPSPVEPKPEPAATPGPSAG